MPQAASLDGYLDKIIPVVRPWSEDLREQQFYVGRHWIEVRDDEKFHELVLHIFNEGDEYLKSIDGDIEAGSWRVLGNKLVFGIGGAEEVFELAFMDPEFFILKKHSSPKKIALMEQRYFVLVNEPIARKLEWRDIVELLFNKYRDNSSSYIYISIAVVLLVVLILILSRS